MKAEESEKQCQREELKVDPEAPLEIKDYSRLNDWEVLMYTLEFPLIKWGICEPNERAVTRTKSQILSGMFAGPVAKDLNEEKKSYDFTFRTTAC